MGGWRVTPSRSTWAGTGGGEIERLEVLATKLVRAGVDVIVTSSTPATLAAKRATQTMPIVFTGMAYPVERGAVTNLARPGGNVTGVSGTLEGALEAIPAPQGGGAARL